MAETVSTVPINAGGHPVLYPWDQWFDGQIWKCVHGEDFQCKPKSFEIGARFAAIRRGVKVVIRRRKNEVYIQRQV